MHRQLAAPDGNAASSTHANGRRDSRLHRHASEIRSDEERLAFINFIAANPEAGDIIRRGGGCRKVRWSRGGIGKRGGSRIFRFLADDATTRRPGGWSPRTLRDWEQGRREPTGAATTLLKVAAMLPEFLREIL